MIRIAVLGTGSMAEYQVRKFSAIEGVEVSACFDADTAKAEHFGLNHGIPQRFSRLESLLDQARIDAVSCCLVDAQHFHSCTQVLDRNLPVFCEKPLAQNIAEARILAGRVAAAGAVAMVNLSKRNAPALHALKRDIEAGLFGRIESIEARYHQGWVVSKIWGDWATTPRWKWRLQPRFSTAGVCGDLGIHLMDTLIYLLGIPSVVHVRRVHDLESAMRTGSVPVTELDDSMGRAGSVASAPLPENAPLHPAYVELAAELRFDGGIPCDFSTSWIDKRAVDAFTIRVRGRDAAAVLDLERSRTAYRLIRDGGDENMIEGPATQQTYTLFVDAVRSGKNRVPGFDDALRAQEALEAMLDSVAIE